MLERRLRMLSWLLPCVWLAAAACNDSHSMGLGSETNWLRACNSEADCGGPGDCVCGVCSAECRADGDCPSGLVCKRESSALYEQTCGIDLEVSGLCAPECERDADCGAAQSCREGACAPAPARTDADAATGMGMTSDDEDTAPGARQLIVDAHLTLTTECAPDPEMPIGSGAGVFDLSPGGDDRVSTENCRTPYRLVLRVQNLAQELVLVTQAEISLRSIQDQRIAFNQSDPALPNPFALSVTGSVPAAVGSEPGLDAIIAEAIPAAYGDQLATDNFIGGQIAVLAQLSGETVSGVPVHSNVFEYRVSVCFGCLTMCVSDIPTSTTPDDLIGDSCNDNAGADGRICFDPDC